MIFANQHLLDTFGYDALPGKGMGQPTHCGKIEPHVAITVHNGIRKVDATIAHARSELEHLLLIARARLAWGSSSAGRRHVRQVFNGGDPGPTVVAAAAGRKPKNENES